MESATNANNSTEQAAAPGPGGSSPSDKDKDPGETPDARFECNICLDTAKDAVISMCGHLFCWPCLHTWLETRPNRQVCPVCKSAISREKVVPLYGRGSGDNKDPRDKVPPRPAGQRSEPQGSGFPGFNFGDGGFQMSFGIGAFPFGFFASTFNFGDVRPAPPQPGTRQREEEDRLHKLWMIIGIIFVIWLILA